MIMIRDVLSTAEFTTRRPRLDLGGEWGFSYDPRRAGEQNGWFRPEHQFPEKIVVPGCPQAARYASADDNQDGDCAGLPELNRASLLKYPGAATAWLQKTFVVPAAWDAASEPWLHCGGVMPAAKFWLNGEFAGETLCSRAPVRLNLAGLVRPGTTAVLTVQVFDPPRRLDGLHNGMIAWNGIYRPTWLEMVPQRHLAGIQLIPRLSPPAAEIRFRGSPATAGLRLEAAATDASGQPAGPGASSLVGGDGSGSLFLDLPGATPWSPEQPKLYQAVLRLVDRAGIIDEATVRFGLREIAVAGRQILLNNRPVFLRGGDYDAVYPETICPPADTEYYRRRLRRMKEYGYNFVKSSVEVFTLEFLAAADEVGILVCQEMPFGIFGLREARYAAEPWFADLCRQGLADIIAASRNHPSVILYSMSSEMNYRWLAPRPFALFSRELPALARRLAPNALVTDGTGVSDGHFDQQGAHGDAVGRQAVGVETHLGRRDTDVQSSWLSWNMDWRPLDGPIRGIGDTVTHPFILHEFSWLTALSEPGLVERFADLPMRPLHVPEMIEAARRHGQLEDLPRLVAASRQLKYALQEYSIELARRHPKIAGYCQHTIQDYPFCAEGLFNEFWEPPAERTAREWRRINADTVLCLEDNDRRSFWAGESFTCRLLISHFGAATLSGALVSGGLIHAGKAISEFNLQLPSIAPGDMPLTPPICLQAPRLERPAVVELWAKLSANGQPVNENRWRLWILPTAEAGTRPRRHWFSDVPENMEGLRWPRVQPLANGLPDPAGACLLVTGKLSPQIIAHVAGGGRCLHLSPAPGGDPVGELPRGLGEPLYRTVPYNLGTHGNMGTLVEPHPLLADFPHQGWCDIVFAPLLHGSQPFALSHFLPLRIRPVIRSIGHMRSLEDKAYLFEIAVGRGRLLAGALRLLEHKDEPLAGWLLMQMMSYLENDRPAPAATITAECLAQKISPR